MRFEPTPKKILNLVILALMIILAMLILSRVNVAFCNPVEIVIQWDPDVQEIEGGEPIESWNQYRLAIGNEITLERDWLGEIFFVAIYDRMLRGDEIKENYEKGVTGKSRSGALALYDFEEGSGMMIEDKVTSSPLNLIISDTSDVEWIAGGLRINGSSLISSADPAIKISDAVNASKEFTIESWIKPANLTNSGPARIVSMSQDSGFRNFTLAQQLDGYRMRILRQGSPPNGTPSIEAAGSVKLELAHLAFAIDKRGAATLYLNGEAVSSLHTMKQDEHTPWERIDFYSRAEGGSYDYDQPFLTLPQAYDGNGYSKPIRVEVEQEYPNFEVSSRYFVLRSGAGDKHSEDSIEVGHEADMTRPPKTILSMNQTATDYVFVWNDTGERTWRYQLQYSFRDPATNRGGYSVIRTIDAPDLSVAIPISEIESLMGDNASVWFTMVSLTKSLIYSRWTDQDVEIQKTMPIEISPVMNIRIAQ